MLRKPAPSDPWAKGKHPLRIQARADELQKSHGLSYGASMARAYGEADKKKMSAGTQHGPRGGTFSISPSGAKVYEKSNPGWVAENPMHVDHSAPHRLIGSGPWKKGS